MTPQGRPIGSGTLPDAHSMSKTIRLGFVLVSVLCVVLVTLSACTSTSGSGTDMQVAQATAISTATPSATATPSPTATPTPKPIPTPKPTATPKPAPPPPPTATPVPQDCQAVCNSWGYDFRPGNLIYSPPSDFCGVFPCIPSFWNQTNGYVVECQDGDYSHSGGRSGVCSYHGGYKQTLYAH